MAKSKFKIGALLFGGLFCLSLLIVYNYYQKIFSSAVDIELDDKYFYLSSPTNLNDLTVSLYDQEIITDTLSFLWVAKRKSFKTPKAGRYLIKNGMSNNELINIFRSGRQVPIKVTLNSVRTKEDLASVASGILEFDSLSLISLLNSRSFTSKYGFDLNSIPCLFIPNTYEFYWNTTAEEFVRRMAREYKYFWNVDRKTKANAVGLSQSEVCILASIVQAEQLAHPDERPEVAGLYLNRIRKGMRLQSDPTLIFAMGDFSIQRVLNEDKTLDSPYNTYKYASLPPGPINIPERSSLEAVLNPAKHTYLYMCAKADFSGYHNFSKSLSKHNQFANEYRRELNRRRIMR